MSEASVISIFPFASDEYKPSIIPASFHIPACEDDTNPVIVNVPDAQTHEWLDITRGVRVYKIEAPELAKSIAFDKRKAMFGSNPDKEAYPGITWLPSPITLTELKLKHADLIKRIRFEQLNWMKHLIYIADDDWSRYHQHKFINDLQRYACDKLGLARDWNTVFENNIIKCPSCKSNTDAGAIVCRTCRYVLNKAEYDKLTFAKG